MKRLSLIGFVVCLFSPIALSAPAGSPQPTTLAQPTCEALPLQIKATEGNLAEFATLLDGLENAFTNQDTKTFLAILHPAIIRDPAERRDIFEGTIARFGLTSMKKMARTQLYRMKFPNEIPPAVTCSFGKARGVVGPETQFAAVHTLYTEHEQIRLHTIYAPVPKALRTTHNTAHDWALVHLQAQVWTQGQKAPPVILEDAIERSRLNEPLAAWVLAEGALRLMASNAYLEPPELARAIELSQQTSKKLPTQHEVNTLLASTGEHPWTFAAFSAAFQSTGIEPAIKLRITKKNQDISALLRQCLPEIKKLAPLFKSMHKTFRGVQCLPYFATEDLRGAPSLGTMFVTWEELLSQSL